jgi:hypothetical protein
VQKFLDREFKRRPNPEGGHPKSGARDTLVYRATVRTAAIYVCKRGLEKASLIPFSELAFGKPRKPNNMIRAESANYIVVFIVRHETLHKMAN